jgi:beta-aspartyl-peptidase (threonine type)
MKSNFTTAVLYSFVCITFAAASMATYANDGKHGDGPKQKMEYAIAIHGGAGSSAGDFDSPAIQKRRASLEAALEKGVGILKGGGSSLDAVEAVIRILEDDPQFNSGKGAVFNAEGSHELDASIMDGRSLSCGAVAGVSHVKNPIGLARLVMTETRHVLLSGQGAEVFAKQQGVDWVEPSYFDTPGAKKSFERYKKRMFKKVGDSRSSLPKNSFAKESSRIAPAGFEPQWNIGTYKKYGRIGDSPVVGAGTYADNATCGVSGTGIGEQYIRNAVAYDVSAQMKYKGATLQEAVEDNLKNRLNEGDGGLIAVDKDGNISMEFNTGGMARAAADASGRFEVIWGEPATPAKK